MAIVLSNLNRFTFFRRKIPWYICSKLVTENPTTATLPCKILMSENKRLTINYDAVELDI